MQFRTEVIVPPEVAFAPLVQALVADACNRAALDEARTTNLTEAVNDAFDAVLIEAMSDADDPIRIVADATAADVRIRIHERGLPIDGARAHRDKRWQSIASRVDSMHWRTRGPAGTEIELRVVHGPPMTAHEPPPPPAHEPPPPANAPAPDAAAQAWSKPYVAPGAQSVTPAQQQYSIRRFRPEDAGAVARAFYLTYGYHYDFPAVYEPRRLAALNGTNRYISIVAVAEDGELAGHYALSREDNQPIADGCGAIVLPAHRGRDLLDLMRRAMEEEAQRLGLAAYYSEPVTDHDRTQRASEKFGAKPCGITLACAPQSFLAKHMQLSATSQRQSCMLYFKLLQPAQMRTVFAPARHREIIERIYGALAIPIEIGNAEVPSGGVSANDPRVNAFEVVANDSIPNENSCESGLRIEMNRADATATIEVPIASAATIVALKQAIEDLKTLAHLGAIYVRLPLEDPALPSLCDAAESSGLFFSSVGPWMLAGADALTLQLPLKPLDLSALTILSDFANELRNYIDVESKKAATRRSIPA